MVDAMCSKYGAELDNDVVNIGLQLFRKGFV
jgi:hypothetical protein